METNGFYAVLIGQQTSLCLSPVSHLLCEPKALLAQSQPIIYCLYSITEELNRYSTDYMAFEI